MLRIRYENEVTNNTIFDLKLQEGNTALILSIRSGHADTMKLLVESGAAINLQNNVRVLYKIIERHSHKTVDNQDGYCALIQAGINGNIEIVRTLLEAGADVDMHDRVGLSYACHPS